MSFLGIDLGTTNSALAYADTSAALDDDPPGPIVSLPIPQVGTSRDAREERLDPRRKVGIDQGPPERSKR